MGGFLAFLDLLFRRPALVVEMDDGPVRPSQRGDDEADPGEQLPEMMPNLGDHPASPIPRRGLVLDAAVAHQQGVARPAAGRSTESA